MIRIAPALPTPDRIPPAKHEQTQTADMDPIPEEANISADDVAHCSQAEPSCRQVRPLMERILAEDRINLAPKRRLNRVRHADGSGGDGPG